MILYIKYPKDSTPKLLEQISEFSKVAEYKINTQKSVAFLYTNDELAEREIRKTIPFTIASKNERILRELCDQSKEKSGKQFIHNCIKKNKILRNKPNQGSERPIP